MRQAEAAVRADGRAAVLPCCLPPRMTGKVLTALNILQPARPYVKRHVASKRGSLKGRLTGEHGIHHFRFANTIGGVAQYMGDDSAADNQRQARLRARSTLSGWNHTCSAAPRVVTNIPCEKRRLSSPAIKVTLQTPPIQRLYWCLQSRFMSKQSPVPTTI